MRDATASWLDDHAPSMGAALAFYTLFSLAPLLLIVISVAGLVFGEQAARGEILEQLSTLVGRDSASTIEAMLQGLNRPQAGIVGTLVGIGALIIVSLVASAALPALGKWWEPWFSELAFAANAVNLALSLVLVTAMFAMIYQWIPRVKVAWRDVWIGAALTALLFTLGKSLIGLYIGRSGVAAPFGAAASLVVLLLWVYYAAQIFLLGAEFTWVYARRHGSLRDMPLPDADPGGLGGQPTVLFAFAQGLLDPLARGDVMKVADHVMAPVGQQHALGFPVEGLDFVAVETPLGKGRRDMAFACSQGVPEDERALAAHHRASQGVHDFLEIPPDRRPQ